VQIVFTPKGSKPVIEGESLLVDLDDSGIFRTSVVQRFGGRDHDEFFYKRRDPKGKITRVPVPGTYVCTDVSGIDSCYEPSEERGTDGFTVGRATAGKSGSNTEGSSWFLFIGPSPLRAKYAARVVFHPGAKYMDDHTEYDPVPGRIRE
jgi:hypothetical protein